MRMASILEMSLLVRIVAVAIDNIVVVVLVMQGKGRSRMKWERRGWRIVAVPSSR